MRTPSGDRRRAILGWGLLALVTVGATAAGPRRRAADPSRPLPELLPPRPGMVRRPGPRRAHRARGAVVSRRASRSSTWTRGRFSGPTYAGAAVEDLLRFKYAGRPVDAIVAADDAALAFLLAHRDELFPGVPVVFLGINNAELISRADPSSYTGLREQLRTGDIVDLATTLRPATRRIVVVGDATPTAAVQLDDVPRGGAAAARPHVRFLDGARRVARPDRRAGCETSAADAVVTTAFTRDFGGRYFPRDEALAQIAAASKAPVYSAAVSRLGQGLLAGSENGGLRYASRAARMLVAVLDGTSPAAIPRGSDDIAPVRHRLRAGRAVGHSRVEAAAHGDLRQPARVRSTRPTGRHLGRAVVHAAAGGWSSARWWSTSARRRRAEQALAAQAEHLAASNADLERAEPVAAPRDERAPAGRGAAAPGAEDRRHRPAGRRRRARLQQPAHRHRRLRRHPGQRRSSPPIPRGRTPSRSDRPPSARPA